MSRRLNLADASLSSRYTAALQSDAINHYATLGLDHDCTPAQVRAAYRILAKQHHPDLNPNSGHALRRTQALNAAYETLSDPERRQAYDLELEAARKIEPPRHFAKTERNVSQDLSLGIEEFLRGTTRQVRVNDPSNTHGPEIYELVIPPNTAPGTRFRLPRNEPFAGGHVQIRVRVLPGFRFKARGSDLRCDLKIKMQRAAQGGAEMMQGADGLMVRVQIPRGVRRGEIVRIPGAGLPRPRGGRGDLLVRIVYTPEVRITCRPQPR